MEEILSKLNDCQKEAVLYNDGPSLVIAGAGSGKTRVLTYKIAALIKQGYNPYNILAITFTNKAANEMKSRIASIVGEKVARQLWMGTFHSIFARILRIESNAIGFTSDFTIYDTNDSKSKIKDIIKELELNDKDYVPKNILSRISKLKNDLITPKAYEKRYDLQQTDRNQRIPRLKEIYRMYMNQCHRANALDFDDILLYTNVLFRDCPTILEKYQNLFQFVLVDEYQDTNFSQHLIVKKLAEQHHRICVVGDDAQSIYSFRGANIENILHFKDTYPEYKLFKLEQNYRSTQNIVNVANSLIAKNKGQIAKKVFSKNKVGSRIKVFSTMSDDLECEQICGLLKHELQDYGFNDTAILYRTRAQSRKLEDNLLRYRIPYTVYGGLSFYELKVVKDIFAYFRVISNPNDEEALKRAIGYPKKGIGDTTMDKVKQKATEKDVSLWTIISDPIGYNLEVSAGTIKKLCNFTAKIAEFNSIAQSTDAYSLSERIIREFGIMDDLSHDQTEEGKDNQRLAEEVLSSIHDFCEQEEGETVTSDDINIAKYLQSVALLTDMDRKEKDSNNSVTLMTIHSAKGLEFKNVIIAGLEEELFPLGSSFDSDMNVEEERRLLYVAITRAEENCFMTFAKSRFRNGKTIYPSPSRFLKDIDSSLIDLPKDLDESCRNDNDDFDFYRFKNQSNSWGFNKENRPYYSSHSYDNTPSNKPKIQPSSELSSSPKKVTSSMKRISSNTSRETVTVTNTGLAVGTTIQHERFGKGIITAIEAMGSDYKLSIHFDSGDDKNILQKYANLKIIS